MIKKLLIAFVLIINQKAAWGSALLNLPATQFLFMHPFNHTSDFYSAVLDDNEILLTLFPDDPARNDFFVKAQPWFAKPGYWIVIAGLKDTKKYHPWKGHSQWGAIGILEKKGANFTLISRADTSDDPIPFSAFQSATLDLANYRIATDEFAFGVRWHEDSSTCIKNNQDCSGIVEEKLRLLRLNNSHIEKIFDTTVRFFEGKLTTLEDHLDTTKAKEQSHSLILMLPTGKNQFFDIQVTQKEKGKDEFYSWVENGMNPHYALHKTAIKRSFNVGNISYRSQISWNVGKDAPVQLTLFKNHSRIQDFSITSATPIEDTQFLDINFDGYPDIQTSSGFGANGAQMFEYYFFNPTKGRYAEQVDFEATDPGIDRLHKIIHSGSTCGCLHMCFASDAVLMDQGKPRTIYTEVSEPIGCSASLPESLDKGDLNSEESYHYEESIEISRSIGLMTFEYVNTGRNILVRKAKSIDEYDAMKEKNLQIISLGDFSLIPHSSSIKLYYDDLNHDGYKDFIIVITSHKGAGTLVPVVTPSAKSRRVTKCYLFNPQTLKFNSAKYCISTSEINVEPWNKKIE